MLKIGSIVRLVIFILGIMLTLISVLFATGDYLRSILDIGSKDLSWGPALFLILLFGHGALLIGVSIGGKSGATEPDVRNGSGSTPPEYRVTPLAWLILIALSIIAVVLRVLNLNSDLWVDEVLTLIELVRLPIGEIVTSFSSQNQHMLYSVMAHASTSLFGESSWAIRLPSVLFGVGSIWAMFLLCRRLLNVREALFACALMTVSYHHIWFSQNARGYMGLLFFTLLATWFWFESLERARWGWWLAYSTTIALGMWIHMTMAFVVAAHGLLYLIFLILPKLSGDAEGTMSMERRAGIRPIVAWVLSVSFTLQLYALSLPEFLRVGLHEESKDSEWTNPIWVITESLRGLSIGFAGTAIVLAGAVFVAVGWLLLFKKNRRLAILSVLPAVLAGGTMLLLGHNLWPRFFFFSMGFGILIVIHGALSLPLALTSKIQEMNGLGRIAEIAGPAIVTVLIGASIVTLPRNYVLPKQDFSGARDFVENQRSNGDEVIAVGLADVMYPKYFAPGWSVAKTGDELRKIDESGKTVWLVYTLPIEIKAFRPDLWQVIQSDYQVVKTFPGTLNGGDVYVCQKKTAPKGHESS